MRLLINYLCKYLLHASSVQDALEKWKMKNKDDLKKFTIE